MLFQRNGQKKNDLQPIHYLNEQSQYTKNFAEMIGNVMDAADISDLYVDDILDRLCFIKPLRGIMKRKNEKETGDKIEIEFQKNFHDEKEWRYFPSKEVTKTVNIERVIANSYLLEENIDINQKLNTLQYEKIWLHYDYKDIRYIIVPDASARIEIINTIIDIPREKFNSETDIMIQKYILISRIMVLEEIRKDW